jgi:hypothetical protein
MKIIAFNNLRVARRDAPVSCPVCGRIAPRRSRQQLYCSSGCRKRASREKLTVRALKNSTGYHYSGRETAPHKSASKFNVLQGAKSGPSLFANAPLNILGGGSWRWPGTPQMDAKTWAKVIHSEIGSIIGDDEVLAP